MHVDCGLKGVRAVALTFSKKPIEAIVTLPSCCPANDFRYSSTRSHAFSAFPHVRVPLDQLKATFDANSPSS